MSDILIPCENYYPAPSPNCPLCPRLHDFLAKWRECEPTWHNAPVAPFLPVGGVDEVQVVIVGLAPGLRGANRTGRPFTGDYAGDLLYKILKKHKFATGEYRQRADDDLKLCKTAIINAVRCVPPQNKPVGAEINTCRRYLTPFLQNLPHLQALVTLGLVAHQSTLRALGVPVARYPFGHGHEYEIGRLRLFSSYHCSRYNTNTGRLTEPMFDEVFSRVSTFLKE